MILAGDIGATNARLALFEDSLGEPVALATYPSREHDGLAAMVQTFLGEHPADIGHACFGVAGPVHDGRTETVNLAWPVDAESLARLLKLQHVGLLNDLEANAHGLEALGPDDFATLNEGDPAYGGNEAVISAGTGLGEAGICTVQGHRHVFASEGGHADFAPRTELQGELLRWLSERCEHVSYERVCSGMGVLNVYRFLRERSGEQEPDWLSAEMAEHDAGVAVTRAALERRDAVCVDALDMVVAIFGAEAGNLALKLMATGGVYLGGGIAPRILAKLEDGAFMQAFMDKGRLSELLEAVPVRVILNDQTALLGAALCAAR